MASILPITPTLLNTFNTCPRQYQAKYITKEVTYTPNEAAEYGIRIHSAVEAALKNGTPLTQEASYMQPLVDYVLAEVAAGKELHVEKKLARDRHKKACDWKDPNVRLRGIADVLLVDHVNKRNIIIDWKGLALDTLIPTPTGWTTMGDIREGDELYDMNGNICYVTGKSQVKNIKCYKLTFSDGETIVCDEEHLWITTRGVRSISKMAKSSTRWSIELTRPLCGIGSDVPVEPYALGLWLADGKCSSGEISKPFDSHVWDTLKSRGWEIGEDIGGQDKCATRTVYKLRTQLRETNLLNNKHIPSEYMRLSLDERYMLLQGIMDGDGTVNKRRKELYLSTTNLRLANDFAELVRTLGGKPSIVIIKDKKGFGKLVTEYRVRYSPLKFRYSFSGGHKKKAEQLITSTKLKYKRHNIISIKEIASVPTQCIKVSSPDCSFLCGKNYVPTHNTGKPRTDTTQAYLLSECAAAMTGYRDCICLWAYINHGKLVKEEVIADYSTSALFRNIGEYEHACETNTFPMKKNGLCKAWCDVLTCPNNGKTN